MKKKLAIVLAGMMLSAGVAMAEVDLKSMSFDELVDLQSQILEEVVSREEFKCVSVPAGEYTVGSCQSPFQRYLHKNKSQVP